MATIACVDLDPVLVGLVRRIRPNDNVVALDADSYFDTRPRRFAATVLPGTSRALDALEGSATLARSVLVVDRRDPAGPVDFPGPVVRRPVEVSELRVALARVAPTGRLGRGRAVLRSLTGTTSVDGAFAVARLTAVTAAAALSLASPVRGAPMATLVAVVVWTLMRTWFRTSSVELVAADVLLTLVAVLTTGGTDSAFLLLAVVAAAEVGFTFSPATGATVVGAATVTGLVPLITQAVRGQADVTDLVAWATLIPLASGIGVLADRMQRTHERGSLDALKALHGTLDRLSRQTQGVEGTLDLSSLAEQVLSRLRSDLDARAGLLLVGDGEVHTVEAAFGLRDAAPPRVIVDPRSSSPPAQLERLLPEGDRLIAPVRTGGVDRGAIVVVVPGGTGGRAAVLLLREIARLAAVAIDNARIFQGIRELTVDGERRRVARDLHDGVIQSLVHVGFELDLVRQGLDGDAAASLARLREVVGNTVDEVRATVNDLRSVRLSSGLGPALMSLARDYRREGLRVEADVGPVDSLTPEAELQLLRIAQEAVSNAVQHGRPRTVLVRLWETDDHVHLQVLDDGVGLEGVGEGDGADVVRGVGLRAMQERVALLGAQLDLGPGADGGTCVQIDLPIERVPR